MFVVYQIGDGPVLIEECEDTARRWEIAARAHRCKAFYRYDDARRDKGVEPRELDFGIRQTGRIKPDSPPGPEHDRFEYLVPYRPPGARKTTMLHIWAKDAGADLARQTRFAIGHMLLVRNNP